MVFVNSMGDLLHEGIPDPYVVQVARVMVLAGWHTYQVLTKRSRRLRKMLASTLAFAANKRNIWWGVTVENRKHGLPRLRDLQASPAKHRFLSIEPLLEDLGEIDLTGINWVIVGGESGPGARPMKPEWALSIRDQCKLARVPFFFKQWGGTRKSAAGRTLAGHIHDDFPRFWKGPNVSKQTRLSRIEQVRAEAAGMASR